MLFLCFVVFGSFCAVCSQSSNCVTPNGEDAQCVPIVLCPILLNSTISTDPSVKEFLKASMCGSESFTVCCGSSADFTRKDLKPVVQTAGNFSNSDWKKRKELIIDKLLPNRTYCGMQHWDDYFHTENETSGIEANVNEFPWLVALVANNSYRCNGFLISDRFFITTLGCYYLSLQNGTQSRLLIGLHHIRKSVSCVPTQYNIDDCTDGAEEVNLDKVFQMESIILVKVTKRITYSDFVRPICLPFEDLERPKIDDVVMISGWGKLSSKKDFVVIKKRNPQRVVSLHDENCKPNAVLDPKGGICTLPLQNSSTTACAGDSGGPIMYKYEKNWFAAGITIGAPKCVIID